MPVNPQIPLMIQPPQFQDPTEVMGRLMTLRDLRDQGQIRQMQLESAQRQRASEQALDDAWRTLGPNPDRNVIAQALAQQGFGHLVPGVLKSFQDMDEAAEKFRQTKLSTQKTAFEVQGAERDYLASLAMQVKAYLNPNDPQAGLQAFKIVVRKAVEDGGFDPVEAAALVKQVEAQPQLLPQLLDGIIKASKTFSQLDTQRLTAERPVSVAPGSTLVSPQTQQPVFTAEQKPPEAGSFEDYVARTFGKNPTPEQILKARKDYAEAGWKPSVISQFTPAEVGEVTGLPPDPAVGNKVDRITGYTRNALYQGGIAWAMSGSFPPMGLGTAPQVRAARAAMVNEGSAAAVAAGTSVPLLRAEYNAHKTTLNRMVPFYHQTQAYANSAMASMDYALASATKVVRTRSPLINKIKNNLYGHTLAGNPALSEFEVFVFTAARDYAKVTSGAALSIAELSVTAAAKADELANAAQTPEAFAAALGAMKRDMSNVLDTQEQEIAKVSDTIANFLRITSPVAGEPGGTPPPADTSAGAGTVQMKAPDGRILRVPLADVPRAKQLGAVEVGAAQPQQTPPAATAKTVTEAELAGLAKMRGTTVDQERERARAAGYTIVR